jgi:regulator of protease activity HflC (stomatin/prohibitin superfamily)
MKDLIVWMPWIVVFVIIAVTIIKNIVIVPQAHAYVIETFGAYSKTFQTGLNLKIPFIQRVARKVSLKEQVLDYPPQPVITKDNVTMQIDTVVYFAIKDPKLYCYGVENPMVAMETLTATTLRNIIGELELDDTLTSRETINSRMRVELDEATDPWGIKVQRVELKNIMPPRDIQEAMEKQMRAEREKRESILRAEGEKQAAILMAEGEKESAILRAEAVKVEMVKEAEGHAESIRLHKEAEAEGLLKLQQAEANAIHMLMQAGLQADDILRLRSFDALKVVADGQSTKIIIPSDIQNISSLVTGVKEAASQN